ncbi:Ig-like domain-containing protein [Candidatus Palauibacter sp.]|uniref:Ig-like domain-containing protein n=1 Tax=Candidatus Palauibacter sp. TaxID=3101350 RepID=UPI003B5282BC
MSLRPALLASTFAACVAISGPPPLTAQERVYAVASPAELELEVGMSFQLSAAIRGAAEEAAASEVRWFAADDGVTVTAEGIVTAVRPGESRVAAMFRGEPSWVRIIVPRLEADRIEARVAGPVYAGATAALDLGAYTALGAAVEDIEFEFASADPAVATVDDAGRVLGHAPGQTALTVSAGAATKEVQVTVRPNPAEDYELVVSEDVSSLSTGDVAAFRLLGRDGTGEDIALAPLWSVTPSGASVEPVDGRGLFVAEEPGTYHVTAIAGPAIARTVAVRVAPRRHTARLELVGSGITSTHRAGDTWVFEGIDGRDYAYLGTFYHDWMKVWDVTDPAQPVLTDSIQLDARRINDVKIHPNNRLGIVTREGASSRRNGIVLLDLSNPAHPEILSEYTDTVTGGVHNVWILGDEDLVYACHNGTSEIVILDISDPSDPREINRWVHDEPVRSLHDVIVQDGYAYASFWNEGIYILDAGAGTHGGTARDPKLVSRWVSGQGNTHVAWRHGKYLFVAAEIYPSDWDPNAFGPIEARGFVEVLDMTDMDEPVKVAHYTVPEAGAHNLWSDDRDRLYVGYYQAGLRVLDISGELRGDLYRQGREIGAIKTSSPEGAVPNWSMTWGAQLFKGRIFTSDLHSGLWIARLVEEELVP